jgi:hypothetical protein
MMKTLLRPLFVLVTLATILPAVSASAQTIPRLRQRCEDDSLTPAEARTRVNWFVENYFEDARAVAEADTGLMLDDDQTRTWWINTTLKDAFGNDRLRPLYPTFGTADFLNPLNYYAPPPTAVHPGAGAPLPADYQTLGLCTSSCYRPEVALRFTSKTSGKPADVAIADALDKRLDTIVVLSDRSTLERPIHVSMAVDTYTMSATPTEHTILNFATESGGTLAVTGNHPLIDAIGRVREASTFVAGEALVRDDGALDPIVSINPEKYFGRVYNVAPATSSLLGNIVIANGFLSGSSWYQNDGADHLNQKLFRNTLPRSILQ